ncbi:MAG: ABC transporter permease [Ilumatobacteraceae bacterium]
MGIAVPVGLIALWQIASSVGWIDPVLYPSPSKIVRHGWDLAANGKLRSYVAVTLRTIFTGYAIGFVLGLTVGITMGLSYLTRRALEPTLSALYVVPKLAILPIFLTIFGFDLAPKVALVAVTTFFYIWITSMEAIRSVPEGYREAAKSFRATTPQMLRHVLLPAALPRVLVGMRMATASAILVTVAAEFVVGNEGLGFLIFNSRELFQLDRTYIGIIVVAALGVILGGLLQLLGKRLTPWEQASKPASQA